MRAEGLAEATVKERVRVLRSFEATTGVAPKDARRRDVDRWWASLAHLRPVSRGSYLSQLRGYYKATGLADPTRHLRRPRVPDYEPRPVDDRDLEVALGVIGGDDGVWVALAGVCGLRCGEIAAMRPEDVTPADAEGGMPTLRVRGKGARVRWVPLPADVDRRLAGYSWPAVTAATVSKRGARALRSVGVDATMHRLRHTAATRYLRASGWDLAGTSRFLGHADVTTTMVYARTDVRREAEVLARLEEEAARA